MRANAADWLPLPKRERERGEGMQERPLHLGWRVGHDHGPRAGTRGAAQSSPPAGLHGGKRGKGLAGLPRGAGLKGEKEDR
jgi:hypothetical protein